MLIFFDVETTGLEQDDKIVSLGIIAVDSEKITAKYELVNEGKKIPAEASSVNHITNEMLQGKSKFKESEIYKFLQKNNNENITLVGHNIKFDMEKLSASGIRWRGNVIDTLRVTKHLITECEHFSLQFLRYELKLYRDEKALALRCGFENEFVAHNAQCDAFIVKLLYDYHLQSVSKEQMMELSLRNVLLEKLNFGKYKGKYIEEIVMNDIGYLHWMLANVMDLDEDLRYSIVDYLEGQS